MYSRKKLMKLGLLLSFLLLFNLMSLGIAYAETGSTDYRFPGTGSQIFPGTYSWELGKEGRITSADGTAVGASLHPDSMPSYCLRASDFGFTEAMIPNGSTITGIEVVIGRGYSTSAGTQDYIVKLVSAAGTIVGENKAKIGENWPYITSTPLPATYGGPDDLWEIERWDVSDILDPDFGVVLSAVNTGSSLSYAWVDYMKIKVYYTVEGLTTPILSVTNSPVTYNGSPQAAEVSGSVDGVVSDIKYDGSSTVPTAAGTYAVTADFVPTDTTNYASLNDASAGNFVINAPLDLNYSVTVSASPPKGGSVSGGGTYEEGAEVTVTAAANEGYRFVKWTEDGLTVSAETSYTFTMGTADRNLVAIFQAADKPEKPGKPENPGKPDNPGKP